ncbi:MAG TPA: hypothetical protein DCR44_04790 [Acholeplasmatales bacterium]|nr:hypothetical protein [Bacillota bacterium]HAQ56694.1 hypothetical protein [Acholeplasmatales bacterium]
MGYGWALKWLLAAILIAAGILVKINEVEVVYATTGIAIVLFSLLRIYPLLKSLSKEVLRTINLFEIVFDTIMGGLMIYVAFSGLSGDPFWQGMYAYLLAVFFYVRGFIYMVSLYFFAERSEALKFWFHLICVTLGAGLFVLALTSTGDIILRTLGWLILFVSVSGGLYLGYDGYGGYRLYRQQSKSLQEQKGKSAPVEKELPKPQPQPEAEAKETYIN